MKRMILIIGIIVMLFVSNFSFLTIADESNLPNTIYVDDDNTLGPWDGNIDHPYHSVQQAIDNASSGDTIFVFNGIYNDLVNPGFLSGCVAFVDKPLKIIGQNKNKTILDSKGYDNIVIASPDISIQNFTLFNGTNENNFIGNAISKDSLINDMKYENILIDNCIICSNNAGIQFDYGHNHFSNITITQCYFHNNSQEGIEIFGDCGRFLNDLIISNCIFERNGGASWGDGGGFLIIPSTAKNIRINNCTMRNNLVYGFIVWIDNYNSTYSKEIYLFEDVENKMRREISLSLPELLDKKTVRYLQNDIICLMDKVIIENNIFSSNAFFGLICVDYCSKILVRNNIISNNYCSYDRTLDTNLYIISKGITVKQNQITGSKYGICVQGSSNKIMENNFYDNEKDGFVIDGLDILDDSVALTIPINKWDNNYYDTYKGYGPQILKGKFHFFILPLHLSFNFPWINVDCHPAKEPYEIDIGD